MIKPVMIADVKLSYKTKEDYEQVVVKIKEELNKFLEIDFTNIDKAKLLEFITKYNSIWGMFEHTLTYVDVQYFSDTRKTELLKELEGLHELVDSFELKDSKLSEQMVAFGKEKVMNLVKGNDELKIWEELISKKIRNQVGVLTPEQHKEKAAYQKEFTKNSLEAQKLGNKPVVNPFVKNGKKYTEDESNVIALDPTNDREIRKEIFVHNFEDKRNNEEDITIGVAKYINKRTEYLKKFGYTSYQQFIGQKRDETPGFAKEVMKSSKELYKEIYAEYISQLNVYRKDEFGLDSVQPWDEKAYPSKIIPIPLKEIVDFYQNEVKDIFPKESKYIIDNFSKEGTLAILESEHKYNGAAATWTGNNDIYYVTQSYIDSNPYSASTLAHEMGHTMHIVAAKLNKPIEDARFSLAIGEAVADTFSMLFAFASMDKKATYAKTIAYEALARLLSVTNNFATTTLAEDTLYEMAWEGTTITPELIRDVVYTEKLSLMPNNKPEVVDGVNLTKKGSMLGYFSMDNHYTYSSYTISFILAIYLADQIRMGNTETFIKILNMGGEEYSTNTILEKVGIDITSKEVREVVLKTTKEITDYIIEK
ncbi:M3 family metallopeptidase [Mycoplasma todarodis]|uniref:Peptidase M3A/M3B catalytic domain-containing protein n=1 Tax=Mycoplasma todarodis TaxID=1937191 RepID=A0A4R0XV95_9MOLU|nr:M3 family metallopeptidase [Mycoplasma todarodis]TCG11649.1 hypothetical protein C4B25_00875 [Mycoplasma todarodis]